jgi:hypothetical protein
MVRYCQGYNLDDNNSIVFEVYDLSVTEMKGKQLYFGFCLAQGGNWLDGTWQATESQTAGYSSAYWNGKACWFTYKYSLLDNFNDRRKSYTGTFFIVNTSTNSTIA